MNYKKGVSIIMPCLNEERTVGICVKKAKLFLEKNNFEGASCIIQT